MGTAARAARAFMTRAPAESRATIEGVLAVGRGGRAGGEDRDRHGCRGREFAQCVDAIPEVGADEQHVRAVERLGETRLGGGTRVDPEAPRVGGTAHAQCDEGARRTRTAHHDDAAPPASSPAVPGPRRSFGPADAAMVRFCRRARRRLHPILSAPPEKLRDRRRRATGSVVDCLRPHGVAWRRRDPGAAVAEKWERLVDALAPRRRLDDGGRARRPARRHDRARSAATSRAGERGRPHGRRVRARRATGSTARRGRARAHASPRADGSPRRSRWHALIRSLIDAPDGLDVYETAAASCT